jgi:hypothetical protein
MGSALRNHHEGIRGSPRPSQWPEGQPARVEASERSHLRIATPVWPGGGPKVARGVGGGRTRNGGGHGGRTGS